jgi:hypothetical protein
MNDACFGHIIYGYNQGVWLQWQTRNKDKYTYGGKSPRFNIVFAKPATNHQELGHKIELKHFDEINISRSKEPLCILPFKLLG